MRLFLALGFFALADASLYAASQTSLALAIALVFVINQIFLLVWRQ